MIRVMVARIAVAMLAAAFPAGLPASAFEVGGSVDAGGASAGGGVDADAGGITAGAEVGIGGGDVSVRGSLNAGSGEAVQLAGTTPAAGSQPSSTIRSSDTVALTLPAELAPVEDCRSGGVNACEGEIPSDDGLNGRTPRYMQAIGALDAAPQVPLAVLSDCRDGVVQAALPYEPVQVDAVSAGSMTPAEDGGMIAPLVVRIVYDRQGGYEVKEAPITCRVDRQGAVIALS